MNEIFWDVETKSFFDDIGSHDPSKLGVSLVSVCIKDKDGEKIRSFWESEFDQMWKLFREADRIIGFNTLGFDIPAMKPYAPGDFVTLPHFDILDKVRMANDGRGASLNAISRDTLGIEKVDSGANAVMYWNSGDKESLRLLQKYCEADVALTRNIYDFGMNNKFLKFTDKWNNPRKVTVDFGYKADFTTAKQSSLF